MKKSILAVVCILLLASLMAYFAVRIEAPIHPDAPVPPDQPDEQEEQIEPAEPGQPEQPEEL